jgi:integrase
MASRAKGEVKVREWKSGRTYALRFWAYGERRYLTLGSEREGWDTRTAEEELENVLTDVRRGVWVPSKRSKGRRGGGTGDKGEGVPLFGLFARGLVEARRGQVSESTTKHGEWALGHLVPYFGEWALHEIDVEAVDEYRQFKVAESEARARAIERGKPKRNIHGQLLRPLSPGSINKTIGFLQWVLSIALEYRHVAENPPSAGGGACGSAERRRPTSTLPRRSRRCLRQRASSTATRASAAVSARR